MHQTDELLDADAAAANRRDIRRTIIVSAICFALVLVASTLVVVGGIPS